MEPVHPVYIARKDVAMYFRGLSPKTLANENSKGLGPTPIKRGRLIFYRFDELKNMFAEERKVS